MRVSGLLLLGCCLLWHSMYAQLVYKLVKIDCLGNPARANNISCHVKAINWNLAVVNMDCFLIVPLQNPILQVQVYKKDYTNQYKPFLIDVWLNMCEVIKRRNYIPYGVIVWKLLKKYTNVNHTCPFTGQLTARNGQLDTSLLPPFPQGFYLFNISIIDRNSTHSEYLGTIKFYIEVMDQIKSKKKPRT